MSKEADELHKSLLNLLERRIKPAKEAGRALRAFADAPCVVTAMDYGAAKEKLDIIDREIAAVNDRREALGIITRAKRPVDTDDE